jgi:hypothetical protein
MNAARYFGLGAASRIALTSSGLSPSGSRFGPRGLGSFASFASERSNTRSRNPRSAYVATRTHESLRRLALIATW